MVRYPLNLLLVLSVLGARPLHAQAEQVRDAVQRTIAAWNGGDATALCAQFTANSRGFYLDGLLLNEGGCDAKELQAAYAAGLKPNVVLRHLTIQLHGNAAVVAAYLEGTVTSPGGEVRMGPWRFTETRVREGNAWKIAQWHFSRLDTGR